MKEDKETNFIMEARQENKLPQAGSGADSSAGESRPLTVSAVRGCPSYSGGGDVLLKWNKPFSRSGLLKRTPPKTTTQARTRTETEQTETEDGVSTGDEGVQCRENFYASPITFFSPMANTPNNRGDWKRKKSPTNKEVETLKEKEERLITELFHNIVTINSLVDRQGPYKNTANEIKTRLRELQKLSGRVIDVKRMIADEVEERESTPKRSKRAVVVEEKGTNTSTGGEMEGLEWDNDLGSEIEWTEVKAKSKGQNKKKNKNANVSKSKPKHHAQENKKDVRKNLENERQEKSEINLETAKAYNQKGKKKMLNKKAPIRSEALLVEVKERDYASVLKEVKAGLIMEEIVLSKVRKTRRGDILLEIEKGQTEGVSLLKDKVEEICPSLTLRALKESANVIIKGLDATVEKEELEEFLKHKTKDFRIKSFWENSYGNKTVIVELPKEEAQKLAAEEKIKIGWMRVPVRLLEEKKKCYRCLEYGQISKECPGQDRSTKCYNCGNDGHKAKDCENKTNCAICKEKGQAITNHRIGSKACPSWREKVPGKRKTKPKNGA